MKTTRCITRMCLTVGKLVLGLGLIVSQSRADTLMWIGGTNPWHEAEHWSNLTSPEAVRVPTDGDTAVVTQPNARVILSETSAHLDALIISNATVSCTNWSTVLYVTDLTIQKDGVLTCEGPFMNNVMSNRVNVVCDNLLVETGGAVQVDGKGYSGGIGYYAEGHGPGAGGLLSGPTFYGGGYFGASHGGAGRAGKVMNGLTLAVTNSFSYLATNTYGSAEAPLLPGSGGQAPHQTNPGYMGGSGGGAVRIDAGSVVVNGRISADATRAVGYSHASAGSGGSVYITCTTFHGINGTVSADAGGGAHLMGGGGGGGRIAVAYNSSAQSLLSVPSVTFSVAPSLSGGSQTKLPGDIGTLWFPDAYFFSPTNLISGQWLSPEPTELTLSDWAVSNVWVRLSSVTNVIIENTLTVAGTDPGQHKLEFACPVTVRCGQATVDGATFSVGSVLLERTPTGRNPHPKDAEGSALLCAGDLNLTNAARLYVFAGLFRSGQPDWCGARVDVAGDLMITTNCWVYPISHPTNGASPVFNVRNLTVAAGGGFNADALGYSGSTGSALIAVAYGPGAPTDGSKIGASHGAGYGGAGVGGYLLQYLVYGKPGSVYGSADAPTAPGSGARGASSGTGYNFGPYGGGSVHVRAARTVTLNGIISALGGSGIDNYGGGASGGGIYIICKTFEGAASTRLRADGGNGHYSSDSGGICGGGGGGGGRIAVWRVRDLSPSAVSNSVSGGLGWVSKGTQTNAPAGSIVYGWIPEDGTLITIR